jgi:AcrR family transcriptional regulator
MSHAGAAQSTDVVERRQTWQSKKREINRRKILDSALEAFVASSYSAVTVDDIIARAEVSRATFYKHFPNKVAIAMALSDDRMSPAAESAYAKLASMRKPSAAQLVSWVGLFLSIFEENRTIIATLAEVWTVELEYQRAMDEKHEAHIKALGKGIPAFRYAASGLRKNETIRVRAHLLLRSLEGFCNAMVVYNWNIDRKVGIKAMAEEFGRFIRDGEVS